MKRFLLILPMAICLFGPAGTLDWWNGWAYLLALAIVSVLTSKVFKKSPGLAEERKSALKKAKTWDKILTPLLTALLPIFTLVLAGLDKRFGWTGPLPVYVSLFAFVIMMGGSALTYWAMRSNPFFSSVIRIQKDRGHRVVSRGPYGLIRHPGYAGAIIYNLAGPILLGSFPALGAGAAMVFLLVVRTVQEDKTLHEELSGYRKYAAKARYRLAPYIW